jgi:hypothetical protein
MCSMQWSFTANVFSLFKFTRKDIDLEGEVLFHAQSDDGFLSYDGGCDKRVRRGELRLPSRRRP